MHGAIAIDVSHLPLTTVTPAVRDISFQVYVGEIYDCWVPTAQEKHDAAYADYPARAFCRTCDIFGLDCVRDADRVRRVIGYVPQERAIDRFLTGREHLELLAALYHLPKDEAQRRIAELLKLVELEAHADRPAKTYSGGMKRKLDIACGLLPDPKVLFFRRTDLGVGCSESTADLGLHPPIESRGLTVVMTTNYLDEADQLCDRLAIIDGGVIKVIGSPVELKIGLGGDIVSLTLKEAERFRPSNRP